MSKTHTEIGTADRIAMWIGGGLVLLGTVVLGFVDTFVGGPSPIPTTNGAGQIVSSPLFPIEVRGTIIALGLAVFALYAVYKLLSVIESPNARHVPEQTVSTRRHRH